MGIEISKRGKYAIAAGAGMLGVLTAASIQQTITNEDVQRQPRKITCEFSDKTKPVERQAEEGLGSLAVRSVPGVNWGQCVDEAQTWISEHNPEIKDTPSETIHVPVQAFVE